MTKRGQGAYGLPNPAPAGSRLKAAIRGTPGLIAYYPLDDANGATSAVEYGAAGQTTRSFGTIPPVLGCPAMPGEAAIASARSAAFWNNYVVGPSSVTLSSALTIEAWLLMTSPRSAVQSLVRLQSGGYIVFPWTNGGDNDPTVILSNDGGTSGLSLGITRDGKWHHYAMTWLQNTTSGFVTYRDGAVVASRNSSNSALGSGMPLWVGAYVATGSEYLTGLLAHVAIYSAALDAGTIRAHYLLGTGSGS